MNNNKKLHKVRIALYLAAIPLVFLLIFLFWLRYTARYDGVTLSPNTFSDFGNKNYYSIYSDNILVLLHQGESDVFVEALDIPDIPEFQQPNNWSQSDFIKISEVFYQVIWDETLENWNLYYMNFITNCGSKPVGFEFGEISFFKTNPNKYLLRDYMVRAIQISSQYGTVTSADGASFPQPLFDKWKSIELNNIILSADNALRIADKNGGEEARLSVENNCTIQVRLSGYDNDWKVRIRENKTSSVIFQMEINPYTGEIK